MLVENAEYLDANSASLHLNGGVFRYCEFSSYSVEGGHIDAVFIGCSFTHLDWYWGLFNCCLFVECTFQGCTFRGTSFPDCRFVECKFARVISSKTIWTGHAWL